MAEIDAAIVSIPTTTTISEIANATAATVTLTTDQSNALSNLAKTFGYSLSEDVATDKASLNKRMYSIMNAFVNHWNDGKNIASLLLFNKNKL